MLPQNVHSTITRACGYATLCGKGEVRQQVELRLLIGSPLNRGKTLDHPGAQYNHNGSSEVEEGSWRGAQRCVIWGFHCPLLALKMEEGATSQGMWTSYQFSSVQLLRHVRFCSSMDCSTPGLPVHHQLQSLFKLMSVELVVPSNHLALCCPLLLPPSIFPSIRVFSNESVLHIRWPKYWSFSFSISPSNE